MNSMFYQVSGSNRWIDWSGVVAFREKANSVLNCDTYLILFKETEPISEANFISEIQEILLDPEFGQAFRVVAEYYEGGSLSETDLPPYQPPQKAEAIQVEPLDAMAARHQLESMLMGRSPFFSPYSHELTMAEAVQVVDTFLVSFQIPPLHWANVNADILKSLNYNDGFYDHLLVAGAEQYLTFLYNNGTD